MGNTVVSRVIEPLFHAIAPEFSCTYETPIEYEEAWRKTPPVDEIYIEEEYRDQLRDYRANPSLYREHVTQINRIDQERNPWR